MHISKEFPDTRQNEKKIEFIRVGDAVRTAGQLRGTSSLIFRNCVQLTEQA